MATAPLVRIFRAPWILVDPGRLEGSFEFHQGGGLLVRGGSIERVLRSAGALRRAISSTAVRPVELDGVLLPGLVNAHAHLELTRLHGRVPSNPGNLGNHVAAGLVSWVGAVVRALGALPAGELQAGVEQGARRCLSTGTTTVGDIDSTGSATRSLPLRRVLYREALDARDSTRTRAVLERFRRALPARSLRYEGISPHAPHTVSAELARELAELSRTRRVPVTVHWAESNDEVRFLSCGDGPFASFLGASPRISGLDALQRAGLLNRRTSLVHGNEPERGDAERIARAGCTLVHCPGTHAFFDRAPFPRGSYQDAGVPIALGTDSLASNDDLDLRREMALYRAAFPRLSAAEAFRAATTLAARALGLSNVGRLAANYEADFAVHRFSSDRPDEFLEELTRGGGTISGVWVQGRRRAQAEDGSDSYGS